MDGTYLILVADDNDDLRQLVASNLRRSGFETVEARNGLETLHMVRYHRPDAVLLDIMMPGRDGLQVCEELRSDEDTKQIPIMMLTAKGEVEDRIIGLEAGADDYLSKPFILKELILRVQVMLRRSSATGRVPELKIGPFQFDVIGTKLTLDGQVTDLPLLEFKLLHLLAARSGRVVERGIILQEVWGLDPRTVTRTIDTHARRARGKLGEHSAWVQTVRGIGFIFKEPEALVAEVR
ncbi:two-component system phosphate regulon response regulator PhoB [Roseimicrobium gellanilyticum]|uniref:Two-component system phosphate regulon response regulator PhoB n=1 Tax=Roseimicrobium gellanilyticum TaxID=748857 RepID=A0A366H8T2_9BACT|nr:response regulator transcription factor [Roseimicrobium gellanilyticum]RBP38638.1 two-component system phosphate regulon response regulator PhoB [Roseimicrobium gellanilyticum]